MGSLNLLKYHHVTFNVTLSCNNSVPVFSRLCLPSAQVFGVVLFIIRQTNAAFFLIWKIDAYACIKM